MGQIEGLLLKTKAEAEIDDFYCEGSDCLKTLKATLCSDYLTLPNNVFIQLNRFHLDSRFKLKGMICHIGPTVNKGHYLSCLRNIQTEEWTLFNDTKKYSYGS